MGISLSAIVIILVLFFAPDLLNFDSSNTVIDNQDAEVISSEFNGENFEVLPTLKKIPVDLVSVNDGDTMRIDLNGDRKSTRLNSSNVSKSYAVFCLKKKK